MSFLYLYHTVKVVVRISNCQLTHQETKVEMCFGLVQNSVDHSSLLILEVACKTMKCFTILL